MLAGSGSSHSEEVTNLICRRGSGTIRGGFFLNVVRLGIWSERSIVAALIDGILPHISGSSFTLLLRSTAGSRMRNSALSRLPQTRSDASHSTIAAPRVASS